MDLDTAKGLMAQHGLNVTSEEPLANGYGTQAKNFTGSYTLQFTRAESAFLAVGDKNC